MNDSGESHWLPGYAQGVHENIADARVTRDSSACMNEGPYGRNLKLSRKPHPRTKHHVDRQTSCEVIAIFVYLRQQSVAILDFIEPEIAPFDPLTPKTLAENQTWSGSDAPFRR